MDPGLKALGRTVRDAQAAAPPSLDLRAQKQRLLAQAPHTARSNGRGFAFAVLAAAAALVLVWLERSPTRVTFAVAGAPGSETQWIAAPASGRLALSFSEGSRVHLLDGARARVVETTTHGARVVLERGSLRADVVHRSGTRWRVDAGPFAVHVVGTRFQVSWDAALERFQLQLEEGSVRVLGPSLGQGRLVVAGQRLELTLGDPRRVPLEAESREAPDRKERERASSEPLADSRQQKSSRTRVPSLPHAALARAEQLWNAADLARFSGQPAQAAAALRELRERFPAHPHASDAAFMLGRLAFDQQEAPGAAAHWFSLYLEEAPQGTFASEALGRLIECHVRLDEGPAAERTARRYLARHPDGPHAQLARDLTGAQ